MATGVGRLYVGWKPEGTEEKKTKSSKQFISLSRSPSISDFHAAGLKVSGAESLSRADSSKLLARRASPVIQVDSTYVLDEVNPPDFLTEDEYKELANLICLGRMSESEVEALTVEQLLRWSEQAIRDVEYLDALAQKAIEHKRLMPKALVETYIRKLMVNRSSYRIMLKKLNNCKSTFLKGDKIRVEHQLRPVYSDEEGSSGIKVISSPEDMVSELKNQYVMLIKYMDQCRYMAPAPCSLLTEVRIPEFSDDFGKKPKLSFHEKIVKLHGLIKLMMDCWDSLDATLKSRDMIRFVEVSEEEKHCVHLPQDKKPLPPSLDMSELFEESECVEKHPVVTTWLVPAQSEFKMLPDTSVLFSSEETAKEYCEQLEEKEEQEGLSFMVTAEPVSTRRLATIRWNPKPAEYLKYQPVSKPLMQQVCKKYKNELSKNMIRLSGLLLKSGEILKKTKYNKAQYKEARSALSESIEWWNRGIPSLQSLYDYIHMAEKQITEQTAWEKIKDMIMQRKSRRERHDTEGGAQPTTVSSRPVSPQRYHSLPVGDLSNYEYEQPILVYTSATPSGGSSSPSARTPEEHASDIDT